MFNAKELTDELFDMAERNGFDRTPEIMAYIDSLVTSVGGGLDLGDYLHVYQRIKDQFGEYLTIQEIRRSAKTNVLRWLNTAEEILVKDVGAGNYSLTNRIEIAKMLQLDEIRCDETKEMG